MYEKVCTVCGKKFTSPHGRSTLCSDECRKIAQKAALDKYLAVKIAERRARIAARTCIICGKPIDPATRRTRYCSEECVEAGQKINHDNANKKSMEERRSLKEKRKSKPRKGNLDKTLKAMNKYNAKHGTKLDYGQYSRMMGL